MLMTLVVGCSATVPDRRADGEALASRIRTMAGVVSVTEDTANSPAQGLVYFRLYVDMADNVSGDQAAAVTARYLRNVATGRYSGYRLELDLRNGANVFAVDSGRLPITNSDQIVAQTRDWISLRREFPGRPSHSAPPSHILTISVRRKTGVPTPQLLSSQTPPITAPSQPQREHSPTGSRN